jgi:hypothetical protein
MDCRIPRSTMMGPGIEDNADPLTAHLIVGLSFLALSSVAAVLTSLANDSIRSAGSDPKF